jgi:hypothetical protein
MIVRRRELMLGALGMLAMRPALGQQDAFHTREVPYVPSPQVMVDEMLRLAEVGPQDFIIDLGSGDGRIVITAAKKFGARGLGVDIDWRLVGQAEENARQAGVADRVKFVEQDLFKTDLSQATVIATYLFPFVMLRLRARLLELKPGTRIVSNEFDMGDWRPDRKSEIRKSVFLWVVPARVGGRWQARLDLPPIERLVELEVKQRYQDASAHARVNGVPTPVWDLRLDGDRVRFVVVDSTDRDSEASLYFEGRVSGDVIEGEVARGVGNARGVTRWRAVRVAP